MMTPEQRNLARHALGLPNKRRVSYRKHFAALPSPGGPHAAWQALAAEGLATVRHDATLDVFHLTRAGALLALDAGERLDAEDFPDV